MTRRLHVDGEVFEVAEQQDEPGAYHLRWISGPVPGYGFHTARNDRARQGDAELSAAIRGFLRQVDPDTGRIA